MPNRRLPGHTGGHTPNKEVEEEQEETKPRLADTKKPSTTSVIPSPAVFLRPSSVSTEPPAVAPPQGPSPASEAPSLGSRARLEGEDLGSQMEEMRSQMRDLVMSVELIKNQQTKEVASLRAELDEERMKRLSLQVTHVSITMMEIEKLKQAVQST
ncbi:hypothetical protein CRUP_038291 [Coryphaenoides rupestris]|nr:hypothetical protein CRUP_038291 [Coryphaenoides rupestris]